MKHLLVMAALIPAGFAQAQVTPAALAQDYAAAGFAHIEIKTGPTQTKVEAWSTTTRIEVIHDNRTGAVLKTESEMLGSTAGVTPGVSVRARDKDFVDATRHAGRDDDDDDTVRGRGRDDDRDDDSGDDDGSDDHGGRGGDDDHGDDHGGLGDDDHGDDHGGRGDDDHGDDHGGRGGDDHGDDHGGRGSDD